MRRLVRLIIAVMVFMLMALPAIAQEVEEAVEQPAFDLVWINGLVAFFLPLLISFLKRAEWNQQLKKTFALIISVIAGIVTVGVGAGWTLDPFGDFLKLALASVTQIWVVAQVAYLSFWEDTAVEAKLEDVNSGTPST